MIAGLILGQSEMSTDLRESMVLINTEGKVGFMVTAKG
jgi:hypothetical protein